MLKLTWFWTEIYRLSPKTVGYFAAVWQITGARRCLNDVFNLEYEQRIEDGQSAEDLLDATPASRMVQNDLQFRRQRRIAWASLLVIGAILTFQPWLDIRWFSSVILVSGMMLCALEFSPRVEGGFVAMVHRIAGARDKPE